MPQNTAMGNDPDWQQGEIVAERSIHLTSGFHASADEEVHLHIGHIDRSMLENEDWDKSKKTYSKNTKATSSEFVKQSENITIYPNPTTGAFSLKLNSKMSRIKITDITGKIIYSDNNIVDEIVKIDISTQTQGIYIVKITTENKVLTTKIIKQ